MEIASAPALTAALEQLVRVLLRRLSPRGGLSITAAATLATLERCGPQRLTELAAREGVTQPAMTQLVSRLQGEGLVTRDVDPSDGRVVRVGITDAGRAALAHRREVRVRRLAELLTRLSPADRDALLAAVPAIEALVRLADAPESPETADGPEPDQTITNPRTVDTGASF